MKKICTVILLCLCVFLMIACKNDLDGAGNSPPIQSSQDNEPEKEEDSTNSEESVGSSENSDLGGNWTGIHSK